MLLFTCKRLTNLLIFICKSEMTVSKKGISTMIKLTAENTARAIQRCKIVKPQVQFVADRIFKVSSSDRKRFYEVRFDVHNGEKLAQCTCKASESNMVCFHIIAGATANIYRQGLKRQAV